MCFGTTRDGAPRRDWRAWAAARRHQRRRRAARADFALAEELDVPVAFHLHPRTPWGTVRRISEAARGTWQSAHARGAARVRHPTMRPYVMHAGRPFLERLIALLTAHPQIYVDVRGLAGTCRKRRSLGTRGITQADMGGARHQRRWPSLRRNFLWLQRAPRALRRTYGRAGRQAVPAR